MKTVDMIGQTCGRLTVIAMLPERSTDGKVMWVCSCSCGASVAVRGASLRDGTTSSCGCYKSKISADRMVRLHLAHGHSRRSRKEDNRTSEYLTWTSMKQRCCNQKHKSWKDYGGRGITVCDRWRDSFDNFLADMGPKPGLGYSIDRKDVNGNYEPGNCRWATPKEQRANQRLAQEKIAA